MVDAPAISVVTPSYNQKEFLEETLLSVLSQEGDFHLDYLVIDGGSSDGSPDLIRSYARRLDQGDWLTRCRGIRFRWVSEKDEGQAEALMKGFAMAQGDVLAWLNSDDTYLPGTLQTVATFFRKHPETALLYGDAHYCDAAGEIIGRYPTEAFDLGKLAWFNFFCQPSSFFRKGAFDAVGGLDVKLHYGMDYDLFIRLAKRFGCHYLPKTLSTYRLHLDSKTMRDSVLYESHEEALQIARRHFGYAPLNLVYGSCFHYCLFRAPKFLKQHRLPIVFAGLLGAMARSLWLNKGVNRNDLKLLKRSNLSKLFKGRRDILLD